MQRLEGKIAVVTGGASGIGRATAELFAREGAIVTIADKDGDGAQNTAKAISNEGNEATAMTVDVSRGQDVTALMRQLDNEQGKIDIIVNNAGLNVRSDFRHLSDSDWEKIREVNLDGVVRIARDGFDLLRKSEAGSLINVASIMGHRGLRQLAGYSATKGAVCALTRALSVEYAPFNIRVNTIAPGFIETPLTDRVLRSPAISQALLEETPMRRFGTGEDVAKVALFLASDDAAYVTGAELAVDGGMSASL